MKKTFIIILIGVLSSVNVLATNAKIEKSILISTILASAPKAIDAICTRNFGDGYTKDIPIHIAKGDKILRVIFPNGVKYELYQKDIIYATCDDLGIPSY